MTKRVLIVLAEGFEEIEAVTPIDILRRAGVEVRIAGLSGKTVSGSHGLQIQADVTLEEAGSSFDAIILPGGMPGSKNLNQSKKVAEIVKKMYGDGKWVTAICAAPALALAPAGILEGKKATCYPGFENHFSSGVRFSEDRVVIDKNVITSRGPGTALEFSLELVEKLVSKEAVQKLKEALLIAP